MHEIRELLNSVPELRRATVVDVLATSPISSSYLLQDDKQRMVLRVDTRLAAAIGLDRSRELAVLGSIAPEKIGPEVVWAAPGRGLLVTKFLEGQTWSPAEATAAANIYRVGKLLKRVHQLPAERGWPTLVDILDNYARKLRDPAAKRLARRAGRAARRLGLGDERQCCLCHGDVHAGNLSMLNGENLYLLDWEYAGRGHPWFDLATFAMQHNLSDKQKFLLLEAHNGAVVDAHLDDFAAICEVYGLVEECWRVLVAQGGKGTVPN